MSRARIPLATALSLCIIFLIACNDNPIWDRFAKNPNVRLRAQGGEAWVDFANEPAVSWGAGSSGQQRVRGWTLVWGYNGVTITQQYTNIRLDGLNRVLAYDEYRVYEPGGRYEISIQDVQYNALGGVVSFAAEVDGVEYSYP